MPAGLSKKVGCVVVLCDPGDPLFIPFGSRERVDREISIVSEGDFNPK